MDLLNPEKVTEIILHCTDTTPNDSLDIDTIDFWHRQRGFECIGYHYVIKPNGQILIGRPFMYQGAHCLGENHRSIGVCYVGGRDKYGAPADTRTYAQKVSIAYIITQIVRDFPKVTDIFGHNDFSTKTCPNFDAKKEYAYFLTNLKS